MTDHAGLTDAIQHYFDLMYESDTSRFDDVFLPTFQMHGFNKGEMRRATAERYKEVMGSHPSPKSLGAPREEEILLVDFASDSQALAKVRVRIGKTVYVDYLAYHRIDGRWLVTSKAYHIEQENAA